MLLHIFPTLSTVSFSPIYLQDRAPLSPQLFPFSISSTLVFYSFPEYFHFESPTGPQTTMPDGSQSWYLHIPSSPGRTGSALSVEIADDDRGVGKLSRRVHILQAE